MIRILVSFLAVTLTLPAQKIDTETPARDRVVRVQTALNHLTVIEVAEPVTTVAVGSPQAFKVERRENKVFIQPLQEGAATNLFIWTATTRLNYELVPAISDAGQMDFAIDNLQFQREAPSQPVREPEAKQPDIPPDMLMHSTPVNLVGFNHPKPQRVDVTVRDVYRTEREVFIRYTIDNHANSPYQGATPRVALLKSPRCDRSIAALANVQLGEEYLSHLRYDGWDLVPILRAQSPAGVRPGTTAVGVVAVQLPSPLESVKQNGPPNILLLVFAADGERQVTATLVL